MHTGTIIILSLIFIGLGMLITGFTQINKIEDKKDKTKKNNTIPITLILIGLLLAVVGISIIFYNRKSCKNGGRSNICDDLNFY